MSHVSRTRRANRPVNINQNPCPTNVHTVNKFETSSLPQKKVAAKKHKNCENDQPQELNKNTSEKNSLKRWLHSHSAHAFFVTLRGEFDWISLVGEADQHTLSLTPLKTVGWHDNPNSFTSRKGSLKERRVNLKCSSGSILVQTTSISSDALQVGQIL